MLCYPWSGLWECSSVGVNSLSLSLSLSLSVFILGKWINSDGTTLAYTNFLLFFFFFFSWEFYCFSRKLQCHLHTILWTIHEVTIIWCFSFVNFPFPFFFFFVWLFPTLKWIYLSKNNLEFLACQIRILWCLQLMLKYFRNLLIRAMVSSALIVISYYPRCNFMRVFFFWVKIIFWSLNFTKNLFFIPKLLFTRFRDEKK